MLISWCHQGVRFFAERYGQGVIFLVLLEMACSLYSGVRTIRTDAEMLLPLTAAFLHDETK